MSDTPTRRAIVLCSAFGAAGLIASLGQPRHAHAAKFPPTSPAVAYQPSPKDGHQCDGCMLFQAPEACQVVDGKISPSGWCKLWAKKAG
jgi:hypothetical protein